jgi:branched-chain amino acid transport system permease protein
MSATKANLEVLPRSMQVVVALVLVALLGFPFVGTEFYTQMVARMMILGIFAMSLDLLLGVAGLVSLGHAALFGLAGYVLAFVAPADAPVNLWWSLPVAMAASALAALVIGFFVVRTRGIYFIMVTMAFAQMVFYLFFDNKLLGGSDGVYINFRPDAVLFDLENKRVFYYFTLALLVVVYAFLRRLLWSPFGRVLAGIRINEHRMRAMGYGTFGYKLAAFTLAGALAGLAGYLWGAHHDGDPGRHGQLRRRGRRRLRLRIAAARIQGPAHRRRRRSRQALAVVDRHLHRAGGCVRAAWAPGVGGKIRPPQGQPR